MTSLPATLIDGKYTILAKLREGGMGSIYKVNHNLLDEIRVIKFMRPAITGEADLHKRFQQEARFVTKLKHRNIASVYDFAMGSDLTAYIVMEYIDGLNLAEVRANFRTISIELVLEVARQTLDALAYLHRRNVIHRDISPDNIMVAVEDGFPVAKLIDLGIAKALDSEESVTKTGLFLGKLKYASPEQLGSLGNDGKIDARADLYSMGVVLYELLTGRLPYTGDSAQSLVAGHLFHPPPPFEESDPSGRIPGSLREVVLKSLAKKREDRFASADEFMTALIRVQETLSGSALRDDLQRLKTLIAEHHPEEDAQHYTPSAQERMNQQFAVSRTPSHGGRTLGNTIAQNEPTAIAAHTLRVASSAEATQASPHATLAVKEAPLEPTITVAVPQLRSRRRPIAIAAAFLVVALLAGVAFMLSRTEVPSAVVETSTSPANVATTGTTPVEASTTASVTENASPAQDTGTISVPLPQPVIPSPALTRARSAATRAHSAAQMAGAPASSAAAYRQAVTTLQRAEVQATEGNEAAAINSFANAARQFATAERNARESARVNEAAPAPPIAREVVTPPVIVTNTAPAERPAPPVERPVAPVERPVEQPPARNPEDAVRAAIGEYVAAQESLDAARYERIYPGADQERVAAAFRSFRSQSLDVTIRKITINGDTAVVAAHEQRVASPKIGSEQRVNSERTFTMRRRGEGWVIAAIK